MGCTNNRYLYELASFIQSRADSLQQLRPMGDNGDWTEEQKLKMRERFTYQECSFYIYKLIKEGNTDFLYRM